MIEPFAVALHGVRLYEPAANSRVGILGAGTIGLVVTWLCSDLTGEFQVADLQEDRLEYARGLGAAATGPALEGEFDIIFDAVGATATHRASLEHLRPGGTAVWIGNESSNPAFDAQSLVRVEHRVLGSAAYTRRDFEDAAALIDDRVLAWTQVHPLEESPDLIRRTIGGDQGGAIKHLLRPEAVASGMEPTRNG